TRRSSDLPSPKVLLDDPAHKLKFRAEAPEGHRSLTSVRGELLQGGFQLLGSGSADGIPHALEASHKHTERSGRGAQETRQQIQSRYSLGQPRTLQSPQREALSHPSMGQEPQ